MYVDMGLDRNVRRPVTAKSTTTYTSPQDQMELSSQLRTHVNTILSSHEEDYGVRGGKVPRILHLGT